MRTSNKKILDKDGNERGLLTKKEIFKELAEKTGLHQWEVEGVMRAFEDIVVTQIINNGTFMYPNLINITANKTEGEKITYLPSINKTLKVPNFATLRSKVPANLKALHKECYRERLAREHNVPSEEWWRPFVYAEGNVTGAITGKKNG